MAIQGLSDQWELPRGGTLRLGDEKTENRPGKQLGHFRFDPNDAALLEPFRALYGAEPKAVVVMLPSDDRQEVFSDYYRLWKGKSVWCYGDNEQAWRLANRGTGEREQIACSADCPLRKTTDPERNKKEGRDCQPEGWLRVLLPELPTMHVFDVTCRTVSIRWVSTALKQLQARFGRLSGIPLVLGLREFKVRGKSNWGPSLDIRESLIAQVLGRDPGGSLLRASAAEPASGADASAPALAGPQSVPPAPPAARGGNGKPPAAPSGRNPHVTDPQRTEIRQLLADPVFNDTDRRAWAGNARQVASPQAALRLVQNLRLERALRACRDLRPEEREAFRRAAAPLRPIDLQHLPRRVNAVRHRQDAEALLQDLLTLA